jgi:hypothetical protein
MGFLAVAWGADFGMAVTTGDVVDALCLLSALGRQVAWELGSSAWVARLQGCAASAKLHRRPATRDLDI